MGIGYVRYQRKLLILLKVEKQTYSFEPTGSPIDPEQKFVCSCDILKEREIAYGFNMDNDSDLGFTFRQAGAEYNVFHHGKKATTLRGNRAVEFGFDIAEMSLAEQQQLMARLTGNYKHGNERTAKNHPRNKR